MPTPSLRDGSFATTWVFGGTGMLARATRTLATRSGRTFVWGRRAQIWAQREEAGGRPPERCGGRHGEIRAQDADWTVPDRWAHALEEAVAEGPPALVLSWIHGRAREAWNAVADARTAASSGREPCPWIDLHGSQSAVRRGELRRRAERAGAGYRPVILGWIADEGGPRWLHHDEIVDGVLALVDGAAAATPDVPWIVGRVEPPQDRP